MMKNLPVPIRLLAAGLQQLCFATLLLLAIPPGEAYSQLPAGFIQRKLTGDVINEATSMAHAPDGRIFMAERSGHVKVFLNGTVATVHTVSTTTAAEQGLLGIALHPQFAANGKCYIFYTNPDMTRHYLDLVVINAASQVTSVTRVMEFDPIINGFHNGGALQFRDGFLYIAIGESNASAESPKPDTYRGKILRLTEDGQPAPGNPYYNEPGASRQKRSIWAKGMRNPWKMSLDPVSQKLFVIDVGGNYEEINDVSNPDPARNYNYGWDQRGRSGPEQADTTIPAVFYYPHSGWGCAITSGVFFTPPSTNYPPQYRNRFYFSDWCSPWLRSVDATNPGAGWEEFASGGFGSVLGTSVGADGNIYYIRYNSTGSLWRIEYDNNQAPLVVNQPVSDTVVERDPASFFVEASGATPLSYRWQKNGADIPGATAAAYTIAQAAMADAGSYRCIVSNAVGSDTSTAATLTVTPFNARPEPHILTPSATLTWDALDTVSFSGTATDAEDGVLPASAYHWEVRFFHKDDPTSEHWHPGPVIPAGMTAGTFIADNGGESSPNIWFRILLTVTDSDGRTGIDSVDIQPNKVVLTAAASVPGLQLVLGTQGTAPFSKTFVVNTPFTLQAISPQVLRDTSYVFASWEHGGAELQSLRAPAVNTTYLAQYQASASLQQPYSGTPAALPGKIEAEDFDTGGEGIAYHDASIGNAGNQYRTAADVDIEGCSEGGFNIGYVAAGEWLEYTVNVTTPGVYTLAARVATPYDGKSFHVELDGQDITGPVAVPLTGGFQAWQTVYVTTPALAAGVKVLRLVMEAADFNVNYLAFTNGTGGTTANIPGRLEAEAYDEMNGIGTEATADEGGGQNIGWVAAGDWMDYHVNVSTAGAYTVAFRVASAPGGGQLELRSGTATLASVNIDATGGWQSWTTVTATVSLPAGEQTLRIYAATGDWNLNWFEFTLPANNGKLPEAGAALVYPNPANNMLTLRGMTQNGVVNVISLSTGRAARWQVTNGTLDISALTPGTYIVEFYDEAGKPVRKKFVKL
ncbi:carbohydrate-binding protein [Chitinophaga japonensis]|uniref:Putative secreted protein (Por secretion system target) n=1 Tax=Chitinophaga japonensis TaxID=104662 RepID=A0A562SZN6_CHIJA|nr:carbohydrate-binding protein [Chitinophaga japonensis]TWI86747.1 putative secreted protein (Por secretion system target) [Chitinophaga japonensis]